MASDEASVIEKADEKYFHSFSFVLIRALFVIKHNMLVKLKNKNIIKITAGCCILVLAVFLLSNIVQAQINDGAGSEITTNLDSVGSTTGLSKTDPRIIAGNIIKIVLGLLGTIALAIVLYAGFLYMTSGGNAEIIGKAKQYLFNGLIGLVIIFSAYSIASFIFNALLGQDQTGGIQIAGGLGNTGYSLSGGAYGSVIQSHFPVPEQKGVPRNTMILVTFRIPINPDSIIDKNNKSLCPTDAGDLCGQIKSTFKVFRCADMPDFKGKNAADCFDAIIKDPIDNSKAVPGYAIITEDLRTVVFNPYGDAAGSNLGSATEDVSYIVHLTSGIITALDYKWRFTTNTVIDNTPPQVSSVVPADGAGIDSRVVDGTLDGSGKVYLNQIIVVNFNEPVIPLISQTQACNAGDADNEAQVFNQSKVKYQNESGQELECVTYHIPGNWKVGINNYQTIQFISNTKCSGVDRNSCGEPVYCLPADSKISGKLIAADVQNGVSMIGTGITDLAGNSLDGNKNNRAEGGDTDNYSWSFATGKALDLLPPVLKQINPDNTASSLPVDAMLSAIFNKGLDPDSVNKAVTIYGKNYSGWISARQGENVENDTVIIDLSAIIINHGPFEVAEEGKAPPIYTPVISAKLRDLRQNCFSPTKNNNPATACGKISKPGDSCCPNLTTFDPELERKAGQTTCERP